MKNKVYKVLLPIYALVCIASFAIVVYYSDSYVVLSGRMAQYLLSAALCVVGFVVGTVIHSALHELGHAAALKLSGAKITEFGVLGFSVANINGLKKTSFKLKSAYSGYVSFVCKDAKNSQRAAHSSVIGAFLATICTLTLSLLMIVLVRNYFVLCLFGGAYVAVLYSLCLNFLSFMPTSDGEELFAPKKCAKIYAPIRETESRLYFGERLSDMPSELFADGDRLINGYYSVLRLIEKNEHEAAYSLLEKVDEDNQKTFVNQPIAIDLQKFYLSVMLFGAKACESEKEEILAFCDQDVNATTLRVQIAYRLSVNDVEWAKVLRKTFEAQCLTAYNGLFLTEKQIVDNLFKE